MKDNNTKKQVATKNRKLYFPAFIQASSYGDANETPVQGTTAKARYLIIAPTQQAHIRACALYSVISMLRYERAIIYTSYAHAVVLASQDNHAHA